MIAPIRLAGRPTAEGGIHVLCTPSSETLVRVAIGRRPGPPGTLGEVAPGCRRAEHPRVLANEHARRCIPTATQRA